MYIDKVLLSSAYEKWGQKQVLRSLMDLDITEHALNANIADLAISDQF